MFVERVPRWSPDPVIPDPNPVYQCVCRLHNKALSASDARHTGRFYQAFYRTQTQVVFQNRKSWKKTYGTIQDKTCKDDTSCGTGFSCDAASKKCKLAIGQPCSSLYDDVKCSTGLCSSAGPLGRTQCIAKNQKTVPRDKHCLANADCDSQNCVPSTKLCGGKALGAECYDPSECLSQYCERMSFGSDGRQKGQCAIRLKGDGDPCTANADCGNGFCDKAIGYCGRRIVGKSCEANDNCLSRYCSPDKKVCGSPNGSSCNSDVECPDGVCRFNPETPSDIFKYCLPPPLASGEECKPGLHAQCSAQFCDSGFSTPRCGHPSGAFCTVASECSSLSCVDSTCGKPNSTPCSFDAECASHSCTALPGGTKTCGGVRLPDGATCTSDDACSSRYCGVDSKCAPSGREIGTPCAADRECASNSCDLQATPSVCATAALLSDGAACQADSDCTNNYCRTNSDSTKTCATKNLAIGATCAGNDVCGSGRCDTSATPSVCTALLGQLDACTSDGQCESGFCWAWAGYCDTGPKESYPSNHFQWICARDGDCQSNSCVFDPGSTTTGGCSFLPLLADGTTCQADSDCTNDYCRTNSDQSKTCATKNLATGATCAGNDVCSSGRCDTAVTPSVCAASLLADGTTCAGDADCVNDYCRTNSDSTKTCATKNLVIGATCAGNDVCDSGRCNTAVTPSVCAAALLTDGTTCTADSDCSNAYCRTNPDQSKACATKNLANGVECVGNDVCSSGRCNTAATPSVCAAALLADGTTCQADSDCSNAYCWTKPDSTKTCATRNLADGAECAGDDLCSSGYCAADQKCAVLDRALDTPCIADKECGSGRCDLQARIPACALQLDAATCIRDDQCSSGYCRTGTDSTKTCASKNLADGTSCAGDDVCSSRYCGNDQRCAAINRDIDAQCSSDRECASDRCNLQVSPSVCAVPLTLNDEPCSADSECRSGFCLKLQICHTGPLPSTLRGPTCVLATRIARATTAARMLFWLLFTDSARSSSLRMYSYCTSSRTDTCF